MTPTTPGFVDRARSDRAAGRVTALEIGARLLTDRALAAAGDYPAMEEMRDRARDIRLHTLANLDHYLGKFADAVAASGGVVHWAADGDEANDTISRLARDRNVHTAAKSKSMVTEEIELNDALALADVVVTETDLGEFIVQLSGDRPSHIIAPVLHRTRQEIGELFATELGVGYTDDPVELNGIARRHLRKIFLSADMGISGVNFGVAESGSVCLVTNEGNGRLTTTTPRLHVAVMGMERLVPSLADLTVMLEVLARSATGQKLSVYTNIVTGPRRPEEPDGPDEFHVVILDNGRSGVLAGKAAEILACIRCGACLNVCPVYRNAGGHAYDSVYSGPVGAVLTPALHGLEGHSDLPYASSLCGACKDVCPVRIDIPEMLLALRAEVSEAGLTPGWLAYGVRRYADAATRPAVWRTLLATGGQLMRFRSTWLDSLPSHGRGWTEHRQFPPPATRPFRTRWKDRKRGA